MIQKLNSFIKIKSGDNIKEKTKGQYLVYGANGVIGRSETFNVGNAILVGRVGSVGTVRYIKDKAFATDNALVIKSKNEKYLMFFYYLLKSLNLYNFRIGSTQPLITQTILKNIEVNLPNISDWEIIANVLSSFDDKIELNNKIIKNLEEQAKQLFLFYLNNHATKKIRLVDLCENIKYGKFLNNEEKMGMYPVFGAGGIKGYAQSYDFKDKQLIIGCRGTCGNAILTPAFSNITHNNLIVETQNIYVIYNAIKKSNISSIITGSTQPQITINNLSVLEVLINEDYTINKELNTKLKYFYDKIDSLQMEIRKLAEARDYLLPKLMNGEIKVNEIKQ